MDRRAPVSVWLSLIGLAKDDILRQLLHDYFAWATTTTMSRYHQSTDDVPNDLSIPHWSRDGLQELEYFTIAWNCLEGVVVVIAGLIAGSISLVGFGIDSFIEVTSGAALLYTSRLPPVTFGPRWRSSKITFRKQFRANRTLMGH